MVEVVTNKETASVSPNKEGNGKPGEDDTRPPKP
jgi:hypothetical protein